MAKFNQRGTQRRANAPIITEREPTTRTAQGGPGHLRDPKSELFLLAVTNMVGESTFYESADERDSRFKALVHHVAIEDPEWMLGLVSWLRTGANMRSASLVAGLEAAAALLGASNRVNEPGNKLGIVRQLVAAPLIRADEPGEAVAYWADQYGERLRDGRIKAKLPMPVKRGIADAARRLYDERNVLKYDTSSRRVRFADVIQLTHPDPGAIWQNILFRFILERRYNSVVVLPDELSTLTLNSYLMHRAARGDYAPLLKLEYLRKGGMTWEDVLSLAANKIDKKQLWEALIPTMGYMALLRNLRNFDQAGVSNQVALQVADRLANPEHVKRSRQLPMRFLSAFTNAPSLRWVWPLELALNHCLANVPALEGKTLILVDTSGSMNSNLSAKSSLQRWDVASMFGIALGLRATDADVVSYSSPPGYYSYGRSSGHGSGNTGSRTFPLAPGESVLSAWKRWKGDYNIGGGTDTAGAVTRNLHNHKRLIIVTDEQVGHFGHGYLGHRSVEDVVPKDVVLHTINVAGYQVGHTSSGGANRFTYGGLTDAMFAMIPLVEQGAIGRWPWEAQGN